MKALYAERTATIPEGCAVKILENRILFEGPLGKQEYDVTKDKFTFEVTEGQVVVKCWHADRQKLQLINTVTSHIKNHMKGVTVGFKYVLRSVFRHFPIQISINKNGKEVKVHTFLGSKEERTYPVRGNSLAVPGDSKDTIVIQGTNLLDVSQTAASIASDSLKRKKHDERIFLDGIYIFERTNMVVG